LLGGELASQQLVVRGGSAEHLREYRHGVDGHQKQSQQPLPHPHEPALRREYPQRTVLVEYPYRTLVRLPGRDVVADLARDLLRLAAARAGQLIGQGVHLLVESRQGGLKRVDPAVLTELVGHLAVAEAVRSVADVSSGTGALGTGALVRCERLLLVELLVD